MGNFKINLLAIFLFAGILVQDMNAQERTMNLGINLGVGMSDVGGSNNTKMRFGYHFALTLDKVVALDNKLYIQTALEFKNKGFKKKNMSVLSGSGTSTFTANPMYIQIPVYLAYKIDLSPGKRFVFNAGPYMAVGVGGKMKFTDKLNGWKNITERSVFSNQGIKRWDFGVAAGVAYEMMGLVFQLNYELGLNNISKRREFFPESIRNRNATFTIGFKI